MKIIIIGNGIVALTAAYELVSQKNNTEVVILGKSNRIGSGSLAAGAMLNSFAEIDSETFSSEIESDRFHMSREAANMWPIFFENIYKNYLDIGKKGKSTLEACFFGKNKEKFTLLVNGHLANDFDDENFDSIVTALDKYGENYEIVDPKGEEGYLPSQRYRASRAIKMFDEGWTSPSKFLTMLEDVLKNHPRIKFVDSNVSKILVNGDLISGVELDDLQKLSGDSYLLANGASFTELFDRSGIKFEGPQIFYGIGTSLEVKPEVGHTHPNCIRTPNRGLACGTYSVPQGVNDEDGSNRVLLGATNYVSHKPIYNSRVSNVYSIFRNAIHEINGKFEKAEVTKINLGWRPISADTYPLIGNSTQYKNLCICTGTKRDGWHLSPYLSKVIAMSIYENKVPEAVKNFLPNRDLICGLTREHAIRKSVKHLVSAAYQHEYNPSNPNMDNDLSTFYYDQISRLHDAVGAVNWGIPVDLIGMYKYGHVK